MNSNLLDHSEAMVIRSISIHEDNIDPICQVPAKFERCAYIMMKNVLPKFLEHEPYDHMIDIKDGEILP
jgi:hypothetical protein